MGRSKSTASLRVLTLCAMAIALMFGGAINGVAQPDIQRERQLGFELLRQGKFYEAQEKFEKVTAASPSDGNSFFGLGFALLAVSKNVKDDNARTQMRIRARNALLRAKQLGVSDNYTDLLESTLASIGPDGSDMVSFSKDAQADEAMKEGEAAFARRDYDQAIEAYQKALKLQPKLYHAALFIGDAYFQKQQIDKAGEWYGRAITVGSPGTELEFAL